MWDLPIFRERRELYPTIDKVIDPSFSNSSEDQLGLPSIRSSSAYVLKLLYEGHIISKDRGTFSLHVMSQRGLCYRSRSTKTGSVAGLQVPKNFNNEKLMLENYEVEVPLWLSNS